MRSVMTVRKLRAAMTAILLGTAVAAGSALVLAVPAQAITVSYKIAPMLNEAKAMIAAKNFAGAKAKFAQDYSAGKWKDVIADAEYLKKNNVFDAQSQLVVGQAYYKGADYAGCVRYTKTLGTGETALALQAR